MRPRSLAKYILMCNMESFSRQNTVILRDDGLKVVIHPVFCTLCIKRGHDKERNVGPFTFKLLIRVVNVGDERRNPRLLILGHRV